MADEELALRIENLNQGERACLRLVSQLCNSKEIAQRLGISRHTVDNRLKRAISGLEVANRIEAARMFAEFEEKHRQTNVWSDQSLVLPESSFRPPSPGHADRDVEEDDERNGELHSRSVPEQGDPSAPIRVDGSDDRFTPTSPPVVGRADGNIPESNTIEVGGGSHSWSTGNPTFKSQNEFFGGDIRGDNTPHGFTATSTGRVAPDEGIRGGDSLGLPKVITVIFGSCIALAVLIIMSTNVVGIVSQLCTKTTLCWWPNQIMHQTTRRMENVNPR